MASTYLSRTGIGNSNNQKKWTFSVWLKKCLNGSEQRVLTSSDNSSYDDNIRFESSDQLRIKFNNGTVLLTNRLFRDNNAYYHIVVKVDTDQVSANDRIVLYINGVDERTVGGYATSTMPNQGVTGYINFTQHYIGVTNPTANSNHFNGSMSHVHFTDGYAYDASAFGETDTTTGEWKAKTSPSVNYGTTGFLILKDGNTITDQSSNSNDFTLSAGTLTDLKDNPDNNFATLDPLNVPASNAPTFSNGNTKVVTSTGGNFGGSSNLGASSGKYYFEIKFTAESSSNMGNISLSSSSNARESARTNQHSNQVGASFPNLCYEYDGNVYKDSGSSQGSFGTYGTGDIIMIAMDLDNQKAYFGKNGAWGNSGVPTSGSTGTGAATLSANNDFWHLALGDRNSSATATYEVNFGNGYFGTTAVATNSGNGYAGAEGSSIFNYQPPTGYSALSTKGLNE
jgi:hypothetical protein